MVGKRKRKNDKQKIQQHVEEKVVVIEDDDGGTGGGEKVSEDYCFVCKDGGLLIVCDHKDCVKSYHPDCVGQEDATENTEAQWICDWHSCLVCKKSSRYQCFCCPNAVCLSCHKDATFARVRGNKGFCNNCLNLALLGEEGVEVDSDGEKVDFKDRETYEGLFKEYWDIIKENEGLTLEDLHNADVQIKKGENVRVWSHKQQSDSDECIKEDDRKESSSDDHDSDDAIQPVIITNTKKPKRPQRKRKGASKIEFVGWASKSVFEFLASIGVDTGKKLSQNEVTSLINKYVQENKLFHPEKRKMVVCDARLRAVLKRKTISVYKIYDCLEAHFLENMEQSDDEGYSSGCEENNASLPTKKQAWWRNVGSFQHKGSLMEKFQQKEAVLEEPTKTEAVPEVVFSQFAAIALKNFKLVYLKRSLVEKLLEQSETFENKVVGSFVKVKSEPVDPRHLYQLLPVTGMKTPADEINKKVLLQVSNLPYNVPLTLLSNDDLYEEDCEELRQKIENDLLPKPTVDELEKKAKDLHEDITKHAIARELSTLKHRIDQANEKGRRAELYDYRRRRDLLQSEEEQLRMLSEVPKVTPGVIETKPASEESQDNNIAGNVSNLNNACEERKDNGDIPA